MGFLLGLIFNLFDKLTGKKEAKNKKAHENKQNG